MASVRDLIARKGPDVVCIPTTATVLEAARLMNEYHIGGVVVTDGGQPVGIFTERDILRRIVAAGVDPAATPVGTVMTTAMLTVTPDTPLDECRSLMSGRRVRHLPVIGSSGLEGLVTSGDVMAWEVADSRTQIQHLTDYVHYSR